MSVVVSTKPPATPAGSVDALSLAVPALQQQQLAAQPTPRQQNLSSSHQTSAAGAANHQDAAAVIQQLLNVEEVEMLHRIFEMEGLIPVMMSATSGVGGSGGGGGVPGSASLGSSSVTAQQGGVADASASGSLCLTMPQFIEALVYVCSLSLKKMMDDHHHQKAPSSLASPPSTMLVAMDRSKLVADATTWTMQLVTQVEGVRVRKNRCVGEAGRVTTASSTFFGAVPRSGSGRCGLVSPETQQTVISVPTSPFGKIGQDDEDAPPISDIHITDLSTLFPAEGPLSSTSGGAAAVGVGGGSAGGPLFAPDQPKLVVKWSEFTSSFIRDAEHKDAVEDQSSDMHRLAKHMVRCGATQLHTLCPSLSLLTSRGDAKRLLVTGGSDGLVKVWSAATNAFESTFSNNGSAWVVGMAFLQNENYIMIATSNGQLTVHEFPGGNVVQKYIGCVSLISAISEVNVLSVLHTRKFGMLPGESGPRQVRFTSVQDLSQEAFTEKRRLARGGPLNRSVPVKPVVGGFVNPTTLEYLPERSLCFFGTVDGTIGCFDISEDLRQATLITGSAVKSIHVLFSAPGVHLDAVTCIRYASKLSVLLTAGIDGCIYKISMEGSGTKWIAHAMPQRHNTHEAQSRPIIGMEWSEPLQLLVSYASDRVLKFWSLMRPEPLHVMEALPHDIRSACFLGIERIAVLTADKTVYVFDLKSFRTVQVITQSVTGENSGGALDVSSATIIRSMADPGGCLRYDPVRETLTCCLRSPVQYAAASFSNNNSSGVATAVATTAPVRDTISSSEGGGDDGSPSLSNRTLSALGSPSQTQGGRSPRAGTARHAQGVVDMIVQRHTRTLFSIDEQNLFMWDLVSGQCTSWASVGRQVRKASSCPPHLQDRSFVLTRCGWAGAEAIRLVTGTQAGCVLTWTPTGTGVLAVETFSGASMSSDVACCVSSGAHLLVCVGNKAHLVTYDTSMVLADGNRRSTVRTITVEGSGSIASARFLRDASLVAIGTVDAAIHFCNFDAMAATPDTLHLKDRSGNDEVSSVEEIILLQRRKQNLALLLLEDGAINVYSIGKRAIVLHARLFRKHEARFQAACVSVHEEHLYVADSLGRIYAYNVGSMSATTEFRNSDVSACIRHMYHFQAAVEGGVSCLACFEIPGSGVDGLAAGCQDGSIRCFAASKHEAVHAGTLGDGNRWDWLDPNTYAREVLPTVEKDSVDITSEQFLDDILREAKQHHHRSIQHDTVDAAPDAAPEALEELAMSQTVALSHRHGINLPVMVPPPSAHGLAQSHKASPRLGPSAAAGVLPSASPRRTQQQQLIAAPAAAPQGALTADEDPPLMIEQSPSSRVADESLVVLPSVPGTAATTAASGVGGGFTVPVHHMAASCNAQDVPACRKLLVKKRFIKPPDIDLGNGMHIADHATEIILLTARESFRPRGGLNRGRTSPCSTSPPQRAISPAASKALVVVPSASSVVADSAAAPTVASGSGSDTSFFITSLSSSGKPLPAAMQYMPPRPSMQQQSSNGGGGGGHSRGSETFLEPYSSLEDNGLTHTVCVGNTPQQRQLLAPTLKPSFVDAPLSGDDGTAATQLLQQPPNRYYAGKGKQVASPRNYSVVTRCIADPSYTSTCSSEGFSGGMEDATASSSTEDSSARVHTRALLKQMAHRLDMVRPNGSHEHRFQKHVERLYESEEQRRTRHARKRARREARRDSAAHLEQANKRGGEGFETRDPQDEDDDDDDEDDDGEDVLASLRSPQTVKNIQSIEEKLRQYRKVREVGFVAPPPPSSAPGGAKPSGGGVALVVGGGGPTSSASPRRTAMSSLPRDPQWMTRVSSQLYMQDVTFTVPSTVAVAPQRGARWVQVGGGGGTTGRGTAGGGGAVASYQQTNVPSLQRGLSLFAPAPPSSAPGTSRGHPSLSLAGALQRQRVPTAPKTAR